MKNFTFIIRTLVLLFSLFFITPSVEAVAAVKKVNIRHVMIDGGRPRPRIEPLMCFADKEAGYIDLYFSDDFGIIRVRVIDSNGNLVDEMTINTETDSHITLSLPILNETYELEIDGEEYSGYGVIL